MASTSKANTSVLFYHRTEEFKEPSESWDNQCLSPEDRDRFKQQMRKRSAQRSANFWNSTSIKNVFYISRIQHERRHSWSAIFASHKPCVFVIASNKVQSQVFHNSKWAVHRRPPVLRAQARQQVGSVQTAPFRACKLINK
ncbi:hypothetical protein OS493_032261 [Desmophyllum pertusum]|uniref:Uncharacterized protein n=1 Tax=Desmophyllum pertusum TaxID=174260 RepID=A0A9X0CX87_9CNID|nr:hypothetical protein OS493_032261 [Desmophyllum pertusum]